MKEIQRRYKVGQGLSIYRDGSSIEIKVIDLVPADKEAILEIRNDENIRQIKLTRESNRFSYEGIRLRLTRSYRNRGRSVPIACEIPNTYTATPTYSN